MTAAPERPISIQSGGFLLEGAMRDGDGTLAAIVLHPHPLYGGDMDNHVVQAICGVLASRRATTIRFNFRGAGGSGGSHDGGPGETADALAAAEAIREAAPAAGVVLAGYSFGAMIAAAIAVEVSPAALILVSPPLRAGALAGLDPARPTLVVTGGADSVAPAAGVRSLAGGEVRVAVVEGTDHGWWPGVDSLVSEIAAFLDSLAVLVAPLR